MDLTFMTAESPAALAAGALPAGRMWEISRQGRQQLHEWQARLGSNVPPLLAKNSSQRCAGARGQVSRRLLRGAKCKDQTNEASPGVTKHCCCDHTCIDIMHAHQHRRQCVHEHHEELTLVTNCDI